METKELTKLIKKLFNYGSNKIFSSKREQEHR